MRTTLSKAITARRELEYSFTQLPNSYSYSSWLEAVACSVAHTATLAVLARTTATRQQEQYYYSAYSAGILHHCALDERAIIMIILYSR